MSELGINLSEIGFNLSPYKKEEILKKEFEEQGGQAPQVSVVLTGGMEAIRKPRIQKRCRMMLKMWWLREEKE